MKQSTQRKAMRRALEQMTLKQMREALNSIAAHNRAFIRFSEKMTRAKL